MVSTPVLRGLRARFPDAVIGFIGSEVTADFERLYLAWIGAAVGMIPVLVRGCDCSRPSPKSVNAMGLQLALNLDGFNSLTCSLVPWLEPVYVQVAALVPIDVVICLGGHPRQRFLADPDWDSPAFMHRYADAFSSNYIAELFRQLAWYKIMWIPQPLNCIY